MFEKDPIRKSLLEAAGNIIRGKDPKLLLEFDFSKDRNEDDIAENIKTWIEEQPGLKNIKRVPQGLLLQLENGREFDVIIKEKK